ncbi:type VI secretion system baseplate subunit TssG [Massilia niastensis]|uniref:type VI secretion system baseplate subunit TssG n=1 Tax=Massilia niastensis TaxID=544911 RepID=UPI0003689C76|nr:type VI secretion system baseplate subunit TssG [Massilia niastensis]
MIADLLRAPQRYEFFQAVHLLVRWLGRQGVAPERALGGAIRFRNSLALGFPASELADIVPIPGTEADGLAGFEVQPLLMGLLGVSGALPLHYTERIAAWLAETGDEGPRAFLDMFSSRQLALFYRAWSKYRVRLPAEDGQDRLLPLLLAIAGVSTGDAGAPAPACLARYAAQLGSRVVPGHMVAGVLAAYFGIPVAVEQFTGRWDVLAPEQRTRLALGNCVLGEGATVGARLLRPELGIRIRLGPLGSRDVERFLPGADGARALAALLGRFALDLPCRELQLVLRCDDVDGVSLDGTARLGWDGFLCTRANRRDRDDVCYLLG